MTGFKLNADGDIGLDSNNRIETLSTYQELVRQRLDIKLKTFKGEWFLDTTFGVPYRDTGDGKSIIGKGYTASDIDALFIALIKEDPDVLSIKYFKSTYNTITRLYDLTFEVLVRDGSLLNLNVYKQSWDEETYEYIPNNVNSITDINMWTENVHPIVHEDLPEALQSPYDWADTFGES
jgi:hypothetical protein